LVLDVLIKHEIHHRGQMTVLMRQAGLRVPDLYGPTKEQWAEFGAPAPVI
ncbi:DinB family protein, partial [Paenibacillus sp. MCAF20]